jgi:dihydroorotase
MNMLLKNARIIDPANNIDKVMDLRIQDNKIVQTGSKLTSNDEEVYDLSGLWLTPGLIDMHTHLREPGGTAKETIETGTKAARAGGYTSVCCMANTTPVNDNITTMTYIRSVAEAKAKTNVFPIAAVTKGLQGNEITNINQLKETGAIAFSDDGKSITNTKVYKYALQYSSMFDALIISHAEDSFLSEDGLMNEGFNSTLCGMIGIPWACESIAVAREIELLRYIGGRIHFAHVSAARSVELIRQAKRDGLNVTCETAPHYFTLTDEYMRNYNTFYKVNPPLKSEEDRQAVIQGLADGTIDAIATDHAPHTYEEKSLDIIQAPPGMVGLETAVGLVLTNLVHSGVISPHEAIEKLSTRPAQILKLNRGTLSIGSIADLTIIHPELEWTVDVKKFKSKGKNSPFDGYNLKGKAVATILNGNLDINTDYFDFSERKMNNSNGIHA